jgi:hypothetical protein
VQQIVRRVQGHPALLGFEAFNEPIVIEQKDLDAFHQRFAEGVHAIDPHFPVLFEPISTRNQFDRAEKPTAPWAQGPGAYAPHIYTGQFSIPSQNGWESEDPEVLAPSMLGAEDEAAAWGTPLFITELGCDQSRARGPKWLEAELDLQDRVLASSTIWTWTEDGSWGLADDAGGVRWPNTVPVVARPFPRAVAGELIAIERPGAGHLRVRYRPGAGEEHEVSASLAAGSDYRFSCDGAEVEARRTGGRVVFSCPPSDASERSFEVRYTPAKVNGAR